MPQPHRFVIDTLGATSPEFVAAALQSHAGVAALPGLAFVRDDLRLYRRHALAGLDAHAVFERLWQPSYEPGGRMWAGIGRRLDAASHQALRLDDARRRFAASFDPVGDHTATLFAFAQAVAPLFLGDAPITHLGFCGAPFLRTLDWGELKRARITLISARVPLPCWMVLVGERGIVNLLDALNGWIVHRLLLAAARAQGVAIVEVDAFEVGERGVTPELARALGIEPGFGRQALPPAHARYAAPQVARIRGVAELLRGIYAVDPLYALADTIDRDAEALVRDPVIVALLARYPGYWNSTAHIHFDGIGPLEREIVSQVRRHRGASAEPADAPWERRFACDFFHRWIRFRSYSFESVQVDLDTPLGELESLIPLPPLPYHVHAVLEYFECCLTQQRKWFDSYLPLAASRLHGLLHSREFDAVMRQHGFADRLARLETLDTELRQRAAERSRGPQRSREADGADPAA